MRSNSSRMFPWQLLTLRAEVELRHFVSGIVARIKRLNGQNYHDTNTK